MPAKERDARSHRLQHSTKGTTTGLARDLLVRMDRMAWYEHKSMTIPNEEIIEGEADARTLGLLHLGQHIREWGDSQ